MIKLLIFLQLQGYVNNNEALFKLEIEQYHCVSIIYEILDLPKEKRHKAWLRAKRWDYISPISNSSLSVLNRKQIKEIEKLAKQYDMGL